MQRSLWSPPHSLVHTAVCQQKPLIAAVRQVVIVKMAMSYQRYAAVSVEPSTQPSPYSGLPAETAYCTAVKTAVCQRKSLIVAVLLVVCQRKPLIVAIRLFDQRKQLN